jgi:predicted  nucleic acid-binding Zn-ribbon protein
MPRVAPAARIRLLEAITSLQRLRHEMSRLSEADEDYEDKKLALEKVIKEIQSASDGEVEAVRSSHAVKQSSQSDRS